LLQTVNYLRSKAINLCFWEGKLAKDFSCTHDISSQNSNYAHASFKITIALIKEDRSHVDKLWFWIDINTFVQALKIVFSISQLFNALLAVIKAANLYTRNDLDKQNESWTNEKLLASFQLEYHNQTVLIKFAWDLKFHIQHSCLVGFQLADITIKVESDLWTGHNRDELQLAVPWRLLRILDFPVYTHFSWLIRLFGYFAVDLSRIIVWS